jgi:hypothetical protein
MPSRCFARRHILEYTITSRDAYVLGDPIEEKAASSLFYAEVIQQYKEVDQLPAEERNTVIRVVSALLRDYKTRQAYAT